MMSKVFLDTNILVYSLDGRDSDKQSISRDLLRLLAGENRGVVSTQVLQEFYVVATKKLGLDPINAKGLVSLFNNLEVVVVTPALIESAIDCSVLNRISFWDGLIVVAAESAACSELMSEDLNDGQVINGVALTNPF